MEQEEGNKTAVDTPDKFFMGRIRKFGPGIVAVLSMMGAGDLVTASVSGSSYGYNLMWLLALSLVVRFVIVNLMGRYQVLNLKGNTIVEGYSDVSKYYPWFIGIAILVSGHFFNAYMITGAGEALSWVFNIGHPFLWSCAVVLFSLFVIGRNVYSTIENLLKVLLTLMTIAFLGLAIYSVPDLGGIARGTVGFGIPSNTGAFGVFAVALSLIGAVAGSMANFLYPYFVQEKNWKGVHHKKTQRNDILFGICAAIVINLAVWVVGAEILSPNNIEVSSLEDISKALSLHLGSFGAIVFYLGAFGILYSSVIGYANGFPKIIVDCLHMIRPERRERFGRKFDDDPWFKWFSLFMLTSPIVWSIPGMPGFVEMAIFVTGMQAVVVPITAIGLMILVNKSSHLGEHKASVAENIVLVLTTALAIWVSIEAVMGWF
ncbi:MULTISPECIES: Nramp family divalent metal transporter [Actinopolyspora]|uniref:Mn2+ and Fe2+ transporters of the NRAMP family n=1 Tax=Actinopolyspora saharensis TaxID=995062 RepID=A0A1H1GYC3_9ACTN|nr:MULTISPECIES: Nramp family divalent metal transporter [Actinopolyspora]NHD17863.1 divalent metal cation transporter [Actinopolyspora sp. BKK2]NHE77736.1 divalent metal cation transporter [Actinopolyspora sp. BKK1]SDR17806.1 Mn2+ and Fe2+ transporters of the NRAMP family [Actinopolyspora saharensis]